MNLVNGYSGLQIHSKLLAEIIRLSNKNISDVIKGVTSTYGVIAFKMSGGTLSTDLKVSLKDSTVVVGSGASIVNSNGEIIINTVPETAIDVSAYSNNTTFYVYLVPKKSAYETGTLTFTNGSKNVTISGGDFTKLFRYEYLLIDSSVSGNDGLYKVTTNINTSSLELTETFTGTTESGLKWKIVGYYGDNNSLADINKNNYEYESYDIVISSNGGLSGLKLASFYKDNSGVLTTLSDLRESNLFKMKAVFDVSADAILRGLNNDITTLEEKYQAGQVPDYFRDIIARGTVSGFATSLPTDTTLFVTSGRGRDVYGKKIDVLNPTTFDLQSLVTQSKILTGDNYLYVKYTSPGGYEYIWDSALSTDPNRVIICKVQYNSSRNPSFELTDMRSYVFLQGPLHVGTGKSEKDGYLFYKKSTTGLGQLGYMRLKADGVTFEEQTLLNENLFNSTLDDRFNQLGRYERLRFGIYVNADKQGWFMNNGVASPVWIGYKFKVVGFTVGQFAATAGSVNELETDYIGTVVDKVLPKDASPEKSEYIAFDSGNTFDANKYLGVWFKKDSPRAIEIIVNGNKLPKYSTMGEETGPSVTTKFYIVEVVLQAVDTITPTPETVQS